MAQPSVQSGTLIPFLTEMVTMDTGTNHSTTSTQQINLTDIPQTVAKVDDGFPSNGQGAAKGSIEASARLALQNDDTTSIDLVITTWLFAKSGCCGGLEPGGEVWAWGNWLSDVDLPEHDRKWKLTATLKTDMDTDAPAGHEPTFSASTLLVGETAYLLSPTVGMPQSVTLELESGRYSLEYQFHRFGMNNRGAGNTNEYDATVTQKVSISISRD